MFTRFCDGQSDGRAGKTMSPNPDWGDIIIARSFKLKITLVLTKRAKWPKIAHLSFV